MKQHKKKRQQGNQSKQVSGSRKGAATKQKQISTQYKTKTDHLVQNSDGSSNSYENCANSKTKSNDNRDQTERTKKIEVQQTNPRRPNSQCTDLKISNTPIPKNSLSHTQSSFEDDLDWCIRQLQCGYKPRGRLTTTTVLRVLKSNKQPMISKRAMMRQAFGDYHRLMKSKSKPKYPGAQQISIKSNMHDTSAGFFRLCKAKREARLLQYNTNDGLSSSGESQKNLNQDCFPENQFLKFGATEIQPYPRKSMSDFSKHIKNNGYLSFNTLIKEEDKTYRKCDTATLSCRGTAPCPFSFNFGLDRVELEKLSIQATHPDGAAGLNSSPTAKIASTFVSCECEQTQENDTNPSYHPVQHINQKQQLHYSNDLLSSSHSYSTYKKDVLHYQARNEPRQDNEIVSGIGERIVPVESSPTDRPAHGDSPEKLNRTLDHIFLATKKSHCALSSDGSEQPETVQSGFSHTLEFDLPAVHRKKKNNKKKTKKKKKVTTCQPVEEPASNVQQRRQQQHNERDLEQFAVYECAPEQLLGICLRRRHNNSSQNQQTDTTAPTNDVTEASKSAFFRSLSEINQETCSNKTLTTTEANAPPNKTRHFSFNFTSGALPDIIAGEMNAVSSQVITFAFNFT